MLAQHTLLTVSTQLLVKTVNEVLILYSIPQYFGSFSFCLVVIEFLSWFAQLDSNVQSQPLHHVSSYTLLLLFCYTHLKCKILFLLSLHTTCLSIVFFSLPCKQHLVFIHLQVFQLLVSATSLGYCPIFGFRILGCCLGIPFRSHSFALISVVCCDLLCERKKNCSNNQILRIYKQVLKIYLFAPSVSQMVALRRAYF